MMNRTAKIRLALLVPLLAAALWYPVRKIREYDFPRVQPQEFRFRVSGVDPYDTFRGRYITLNIMVPEVKTEDFSHKRYRFAVLGRGKDGLAEVTELRNECDPARACVRIQYNGVRREWKGNRQLNRGNYNFRFPFTRYYLSEENAPAAERLLQKAKHAELLVLVYPNGNYAVRDLIIDGKPVLEAVKQTQN